MCSTDFVTRTAAQSISGVLSAATAVGEMVKISLDNGATWQTATNTVGTSGFSYVGALTGSNTLHVRVEDVAGNAGLVKKQAYVFDAMAPMMTVNTLAFSADTGVSSTDFVTRTAAQTISPSYS